MSNIAFNKAIYTITTYRKTDETKARAKELINELTSGERELILSILNTKDDLLAAAAGSQGLTVKLLSISAKDNTDTLIPLTHEKDAELSSCGKTMMNVWRAIKDFFGTRISDAKLLKKIDKFSMNAAIERMNSIDVPFDQHLLDDCPYDIEAKVTLLEQSKNYNLDLTPTQLGMIFNNDFSVMKRVIGNQIIEVLANGETYEDVRKSIRNYCDLRITHMIKKEFFSDNSVFTAKNLVTKLQDIGFDNLSQAQKNIVLEFFIVFERFNPE